MIAPLTTDHSVNNSWRNNPADSVPALSYLKENTMHPYQWYIARSAMQQELKAERWLAKKGVETFCPLVQGTNKRGRPEYRPLFSNFIFVHTGASVIPKLIKRPLVISMVYWMSEPAIVSDEEIGALRMAANGYAQLELEKTAVSPGAGVIISPENGLEMVNGSPFNYSGLDITLPSLGYRMKARQMINRSPEIEKIPTGNFWLQRNLSALSGFRLF